MIDDEMKLNYRAPVGIAAIDISDKFSLGGFGMIKRSNDREYTIRQKCPFIRSQKGEALHCTLNRLLVRPEGVSEKLVLELGIEFVGDEAHNNPLIRSSQPSSHRYEIRKIFNILH